MLNKDIRAEVIEANLKLWQIASKLSLSDGNFSRKLRKELSPNEKDKIRIIIAELKKEGETHDS